jgi:hypothetical protein
VSYLLRIVLPDAPGALGAVATALGHAGADIVSVDIVERGGGLAVDDLVVELPPGRLPDGLVTAATSVPEVTVETIRPYAGGPLETHRELEVIEAMAERPAAAMRTLADALPRVFRAGWAVVLRQAGGEYAVVAASPAAPDLAGVALPWLPVTKPVMLDPDGDWLPSSWRNLGTELVATPLGELDRVVLVGRPGGPVFRNGELARLAHLTGIAATVLASAR